MFDALNRSVMDQLTHIKTANLYKAHFTTPEGKKILQDLAIRCNYDRSSFDPDPIKMAYREGRRSVVLDILNILAYNLEDIMDEELEETIDV